MNAKDASALSSWMTYGVGFSTGVNSASSLLIYLFRHEEIRKCSSDLYNRLFNQSQVSVVPLDLMRNSPHSTANK
jgi:hypothetical protein